MKFIVYAEKIINVISYNANSHTKTPCHFLARREESGFMFGFFSKFFKLLKPRRMKDWLGRFSTINQFIMVFLGFIILIILQVVLGSILLVTTNLKAGYGSIRLNNELSALSRAKQKLTEVQVIGNEKYSQINNRSTDKILRDIKALLHRNHSFYAKYTKTIDSNLRKLSNASRGTITYQKYQVIRSKVRQLRNLLTKQEQVIRKLRDHNLNLTWVVVLLCLWLLMIFVGAGFFYWTLITIRITAEHQNANKYFENITKRYRQGHLEKEIPDFPGMEFKSLQAILQDYFQQICKYCQNLQIYANEMPSIMQDLVSAIKHNNEHCLNVKESLRKIIDDSYHSLDFFPEIAERIKNINLDLAQSQKESANLRHFFEKAGEVFQDAPLEIEKIAGDIESRDLQTKEINLRLKELRKFIDDIQQIVTIFDSIAQQTTVLSLNASIEAARAGASGSGFDIAAAEIDILADRIGVIPQDLLKTITKVQKRMIDTIRANELIVPQHKQGKKYFDIVKSELDSFWKELELILNELREYSDLVNQFETSQKSLEQSTAFLAKLNQQLPVDYGRVTSVLDVLGKSEQLPESVDQITVLLEKLNQKLNEALN
jgi:methyl-accepting chemotaxis protein